VWLAGAFTFYTPVSDMARCFKCETPCFLIPACPEHADEWFAFLEQADARVTQALEEVESQLATKYHLSMPCRKDLIERWRAGELQPDDLLREWRQALLDYTIQCGSKAL
jgi:hypothetical protein